MARSPGRAKIVLSHDYLTQFGGAERVALELARILNPDYIITSTYRPKATFSGFSDFYIRQSVIGRLPGFNADPRFALPFLPAVWSAMEPIDADLVVCSSSGWAHSIPVTPTTKKIVYCHNTARWLYQTEEYLSESNVFKRMVIGGLKPALVWWDKAAARSCDLYLANSTSVAGRVKRAYGIDAKVLFPPVAVDFLGGGSPAMELPENFFLTVARRRAYKGTDVLVDAFSAMPDVNLVIIGGWLGDNLPRNIRCLGRVSDDELRLLYASARALISVSKEDFGLTPLEANSFGTPALLLRAGGFLDSTVEGVNGMFIESIDRPSIVTAVRSFPWRWRRDLVAAHAEKFSCAAFRSNLLEIIRAECALDV